MDVCIDNKILPDKKAISLGLQCRMACLPIEANCFAVWLNNLLILFYCLFSKGIV